MNTPNVHTSEHHSVRKRDSTKQPPTAALATVKPHGSATHRPALIDSDQRDDMIRKAAYFRAARRGFCPGQEVEDWLAAEKEIDHMLTNSEGPRLCDY